MKDALESRINERIPGGHPCISWLVKHSTCTMSRRRRDQNGITPHRRWKGEEFKTFVAEFGESVRY